MVGGSVAVADRPRKSLVIARGYPRAGSRAPVPSEACGRPGVAPRVGIFVPERVDPCVRT